MLQLDNSYNDTYCDTHCNDNIFCSLTSTSSCYQTINYKNYNSINNNDINNNNSTNNNKTKQYSSMTSVIQNHANNIHKQNKTAVKYKNNNGILCNINYDQLHYCIDTTINYYKTRYSDIMQHYNPRNNTQQLTISLYGIDNVGYLITALALSKLRYIPLCININSTLQVTQECIELSDSVLILYTEHNNDIKRTIDQLHSIDNKTGYILSIDQVDNMLNDYKRTKQASIDKNNELSSIFTTVNIRPKSPMPMYNNVNNNSQQPIDEQIRAEYITLCVHNEISTVNNLKLIKVPLRSADTFIRCKQLFDYNDNDVVYCTTPLWYRYTWYKIANAWSIGTTIIFPTNVNFTNNDIVNDLHTIQPTIICVTPKIIQQLIHDSTAIELMKRLKYVMCFGIDLDDNIGNMLYSYNISLVLIYEDIVGGLIGNSITSLHDKVLRKLEYGWKIIQILPHVRYKLNKIQNNNTNDKLYEIIIDKSHEMLAIQSSNTDDNNYKPGNILQQIQDSNGICIGYIVHTKNNRIVDHDSCNN